MNNLVTRALSGAIYVAAMISAIVSENTILFACIFTVTLAMGLREFYSLCKNINGANPLDKLCIVAGIIAFLCSIVAPVYGFYAFLPFWAILFIAEVFRKGENPMHNLAFGLLGLMYVAFPFCCMSQIWQMGYYYLLAFYIFVWVSDTGAYCSGKLFGKHKMCERISPKKTWEGTTGGLVFSLIVGYIASNLITGVNNPLGLSTGLWMLFAATSFAIGTLGDLVESVFKRYLGIKDSGKFLPGHGGVLDRFDSALLGAPFILFLLTAIKLCSEML